MNSCAFVVKTFAENFLDFHGDESSEKAKDKADDSESDCHFDVFIGWGECFKDELILSSDSLLLLV